MRLLPEPRYIEEKQGFFRLGYRGEIRLGAGCSAEAYGYAGLLKEEIMLVTACDYGITTVTGVSEKNGNRGCFLMMMEKTGVREGYRISVTEDGIVLTGGGEAGLLYAVQTMRQLIRQFGARIPAVEIEDKPAIANRGFYQDVSRGRIPTLAELKRLADRCSFYKINQLQLYVEHSYLFEGFGETWREDTPLTAEEIMELDAYCASLHIDLVPSLSSFGHLYGVLRTKQYGHLSEISDERKGYYMTDRMAHHTVDVSNDKSFEMVSGRIRDYMKLFRSSLFNVCADETYDLGKGKSRKLADERGVTGLYLDFLNRLCEVVIEEGKTPMFWGDIILKNPENIAGLPKEAICLNWEYDPEVKEDNTRAFVEAGAKHLYVCPGVQSWHWMINKHHDAYRNISGMCRLAHQYRVEGVLNTCWGDLGHMAHPEFATIGLIYGAAFSWSDKEMPEDEINAAISVIEYGDLGQKVVKRLSALSSAQVVNWWQVVEFKERVQKGEDMALCCENLLKKDASFVRDNLSRMEKIMQELYDSLLTIDSRSRGKITAYLLMARGHIIWTKVCCTVADSILHCGNPLDIGVDNCESADALAAELEEWLMDYKKMWRSVAKESELFRLVDVACWYADYLRDIESK